MQSIDDSDMIVSDLSQKSSSNLCLDLHFALVRGLDKEIIKSYIDLIVKSGVDIDDLFILFLQQRIVNVKEFYLMFECLYRHFPNTCHMLLPLFGNYGYWKDILNIAECNRSSLRTIDGILTENQSNDDVFFILVINAWMYILYS